MTEIELKDGKVAIIDDADFELVSKYKWYLKVCKAKSKNAHDIFYAVSIIRKDGKKTSISMHRLITGVTDSATFVDHKNHNGLDNTRNNLRICSNMQNQCNTRLLTANSTGYKGVHFYKNKIDKKPYRVRINLEKKKLHIGYFDCPVKAAEAYDQAAIHHFGEFASTNKMLGLL